MSVTPTDDSASRATERLLIETTSVPFHFDTLWSEVEATFQSILRWETSAVASATQVIAASVTRAYVLVYHLLSHPCLDPPRVHFDGKDLSEGQQSLAVYLKFRNVLQSHLAKIVLPQVEGDRRGVLPTTEAYVHQWRSFLVAVTNLKTVFSALAPTWVSLGFEENPFEDIEKNALNIWAETVLTAEIQRRIEAELTAYAAGECEGSADACSGEYVRELKDTLAMLPDQTYYTTILERIYVTGLRKHFTHRAHLMRSDGVHFYAAAVLKVFEEESERAGKYLKSKKLAIDQLVSIFVDENIDFFQTSSFADWMGDWKSPETRQQIYCVYNLLSRSRRVGLPLLEERFTAAVVEMTAGDIRKAVMAGAKDGYGSIIHAFLVVIKGLRDVITDAFHEDACMVEAMENGLRNGLFVGGRGVIDYKLLAERLAALSCGAFQPTEMHRQDQLTIEDIVCVYFFLLDSEPSAKEVFLVSYQKQLARRLLSGEYDAQLEQKALSLLVQVKQSPILFACRTMIRAVGEGSIRAACLDADGVSCQVVVLPRGTWPAPQAVDFQIPAHLQSVIDRLGARVSKSLVEQRVTLATALSGGVVRMKLPAGSPLPFVRLHVSLLQMCVLDLLNRRPALAFQELHEALGSLSRDTTAALAPFVAAGIVECALPPTAATTVRLNPRPSFPPGTARLTLIPEVTQVDLLPSPGSADALLGKGALHLHPQAVETRVVQLLKAEGPKALDEIHEHVARVLSPSPVSRADLKVALEKLLAREFVARDDTTKQFKYLP